MFRLVLALVIAAHGIGHTLFLAGLWGFAHSGQSTRSWLLSSDTGVRLVGSLLWAVVTIGFCLVAYGLWSQQPWWRSAAIAFAILSALGLIVFWANPISSPVVFALAFNILVLAALLVVHWPDVEVVGA